MSEAPESDSTILEVEGVSKHFPVSTGFLASLRGTNYVRAVDDVSLDIKAGETLALVGESGCGKTTLARAILQLERPTSGTVRYNGTDLTALPDRKIRPLRRNMMMIFQDPHSSLNPRMQVGRIIEEPMEAHGLYDEETRRERARELLDKVGLDPSHYYRYPHEFSGGQRQRVNLARALSTDPDLIMCDEPVSALDVTIQAQVLNTMMKLQDEFDVTYVFISHDLSVVRYIADRVAVMYLGHIVELAEKEELFENPQHPYTRALLEAIPVPDPAERGVRAVIEGDVPSPVDPPSGCRFRTRCPRLIQPGTFGVPEGDGALKDYGLPEEDWRQVVRFSRAVKRRSFTTEEVDDVRDFVAETYFAGDAPRGSVGDVIDESIHHIATGEWEEAGSLLERVFEEPSICARERPAFTVEPKIGTEEHFAACHLHRE